MHEPTTLLTKPPSADIFDQYHDLIYRYIHRLVGDGLEAEDLTQETFLRAHQNLADLQSPTALRSWLYRIATNLCYDRFRQSSFRKEVQSLDEEDCASRDPTITLFDGANGPMLEQVIDQEEMKECIQSYIGRLADDYRITILLHDIHGMSCSEISQALACSLETTKIRLYRARQKLKIILAAGCQIGADSSGNITCDPRHSVH